MAKTFTVTRPRLQPIDGTASFLFDVPEVASQTHLEGALVNWNAAGGVAEMADNAAVNLAGIAELPGQNAAGKTTKIAPLREGAVVDINLAVAGANTRVLALTDIGLLGGFVKRSIGTLHWVFDPAQTQKHGRIIGISPLSHGSPDGLPGALGDTNARVLVAILSVTATASLQIGW